MLSLSAEEVGIFNPSSGLSLAATVGLPESGFPRGGIVLISGSGLQDRDETIFGHKPFRSLSDSLVAAGFAVLRYDDRGYGESEADHAIAEATTDDFATDARACLQYLDSLLNAGGASKRIPVGCIGHSEGGSIAIKLAAAKEAPLDFIITLAAPAFRGDSIILDQVRIGLEQVGQIQIWKSLYPQLRARYDLLMSPIPDYAVKASLYADISAQPGAALADKERLNAEINAMASPWYRNMLRYDPSGDISAINIPWLAINGERDTQVHPHNLQRIAQLNPKAVTICLPGINHILLKSSTGAVSEYPSLQGDCDSSVTTEIINFLNELYK